MEEKEINKEQEQEVKTEQAAEQKQEEKRQGSDGKNADNGGLTGGIKSNAARRYLMLSI